MKALESVVLLIINAVGPVYSLNRTRSPTTKPLSTDVRTWVVDVAITLVIEPPTCVPSEHLAMAQAEILVVAMTIAEPPRVLDNFT